MTSSDELILLDTGVLVHLIRGNRTGRWIDRHFRLRERSDRPLNSVVTIGELLALARKWDWRKAKTGELEHLVSGLVVVDIHSQPVLRSYAEA